MVQLNSSSNIINCKAINGGAVYADLKSDTNGTVNAHGNINACDAGESGGAIYAVSEGFALMQDGGRYEENYALQNGGALYFGNITAWNNQSTGYLKNVTFSQNKAGGSGGAVYAAAESSGRWGTLLYNASVSFLGNSANNGGALYLKNLTVTTKGAYNLTFQENTATKDGGAIYFDATSENLTLPQAIFSKNTANGNGGGIYLNGGDLSIEKAKITENQAANGGGIYAAGGTVTLKADNGIDETNGLHNNAATNNGGALYLNTGSKLTLSSAVRFTKNKAVNGGAIYAAESDSSNVHTINNITLAQNEASNNGGALYAAGASFTSDGGALAIDSNTAGKDGGAVYAAGGANLKFDNAQFNFNEADGNGGALAVENSTVALKVLHIYGSTAGGNGGGIYLNGGTITNAQGGSGGTELTSGGGLNKNTAEGSGGGLYIASGLFDSSQGVTARYNEAKGNGGAVYNSGTFTAGGGWTFQQNKADMAGAVYLDGGKANLPNADITQNTGAEKGHQEEGTGQDGKTVPGKESSCGGVYVGKNATAVIWGKVVITDNKAGERTVNLLIDNSGDGTVSGLKLNNSPYSSYGLQKGSSIGVSLTEYPLINSYYLVQSVYDTKETKSDNNITAAYEGYFKSDRSDKPYAIVVNKEAKKPAAPVGGASVDYKVYLGYQGVTATGTPKDKYYDGNDDMELALGDITWGTENTELLNALKGMKKDDYTITATASDAKAGVGKTVHVTITIKDEELLNQYEELLDGVIEFDAKASIKPLPLIFSAKVDDKYYDGTTNATATVSFAIDEEALDKDLKAPVDIPDNLIKGNDYELKNVSSAGTLAAGPDTELQFPSADANWQGDGYTLSGTATLKGDAATNYTLTDNGAFSGTAHIWRLPITVTPAFADKPYDGNVSATVDKDGKFTVKLNADKIAEYDEAETHPHPGQTLDDIKIPDGEAGQLPEAFEVAGGSSFASEDVLWDGSEVAEQEITYTLADEDSNKKVTKNYEIVLGTATAKITPKEVTVTATAENKVYDGNTTVKVTVSSVSGVVDGETLTYKLDEEKTCFVDKNVKRSDSDPAVIETVSVTVAGELTAGEGTNSKNYILKEAPTTSAKITPVPLTATLLAADKYYDATTAAQVTGVKFEGLVNGEVLTMDKDYSVTGTAAFTSKDAAQSVPVGDTGITDLNTSLTNNYTLPTSASGSARIWPLPLVVSFGAEDRDYVKDDTSAVLTAGSETVAVDKTWSADGAPSSLPESIPSGAESEAAYDLENLTFIDGVGKPTDRVGVHEVKADLKNNNTDNFVWRVQHAQAEILGLSINSHTVFAPDKLYDGTTDVVDSENYGKFSITLTDKNENELVEGEHFKVVKKYFADKNVAWDGSSEVVQVGVKVEIEFIGEYEGVYSFPAGTSGVSTDPETGIVTLDTSAKIYPRPITPVSVEADDKLYDENNSANAHDLILEGTLENEPLTEGVDYVITNATFDTPEVGVDKDVTVWLKLQGTDVLNNYVLTKETVMTKADITNHLDIHGTHTEEVSSGTMTPEQIDQWIKDNFENVPANGPELVIKDKDGNVVTGIDKTKPGDYTIEATYSDGNGQTVTYHIEWHLTEKPAPAPDPAPANPATPSPAAVGVQTGDSYPLAVFAVLFALACTGIAVVLIMDHVRKRNSGRGE